MTTQREALPYYDEPPTKLEMLVALVSKTAKSDAYGSVHPLSVRVPSVPFATIQAISQHSGMSMNKVICALLDVALDELWGGLSEEDCEPIAVLRSTILRDIMTGERGNIDAASEGEI